VFVVASGRRPPYTESDGRYARVVVLGRSEYGDEATRRFVRRLRERMIPGARFPEGATVHVGGAPAQGVDFLSRAYDAFPWLVAVMLVLTYVVLLRAFRSLLVPLKAVVLNLLTVAAACGLLVVIFQWGFGTDALGLYERGQIEAWIPIFLFATLFGLSMDYEVFLVTRMRESWDRTHDNSRAIAYGIERTGRIITAAALIMTAAFLGFAVGRVAPLQEFGVGLALAVLIDATIVRMILVPSLMAVLGRYNWWLPASIARLVRTSPSPLAKARSEESRAPHTVSIRD
jgi:RND superfamily putative drug exporter